MDRPRPTTGLDFIRLTPLDVGDRPFPVDSRYVERFWLPVLGPTSVMLLRLTAELMAARVYAIAPDDLCRCLGLGVSRGEGPMRLNHPLIKSVTRLERFGLAAFAPTVGELAVATRLGWITGSTRRHLPPVLYEQHALLRTAAAAT